MWNIHVEYAVFGNSVLSEHKCQNTGKLMKWGAIFFGLIHLEKNKLVYDAML